MPVDLLGVIDPADCDTEGVPLDWERCRTCRGDGRGLWRRAQPHELGRGVNLMVLDPLSALRTGAERAAAKPCPDCGGHGSLKAAALAAARERRELVAPADLRVGDTIYVDVLIEGDEYGEERREVVSIDPLVLRDGDREYTWKRPRRGVYRLVNTVRCEGCGHPMSDGERGTTMDEDALPPLQRGEDPLGFHWSPCDAGCRHGGPFGVVHHAGGPVDPTDSGAEIAAARMVVPSAGALQASWRAVDVRTMGWPHDLRPQRLAILCLRCYAERTTS